MSVRSLRSRVRTVSRIALYGSLALTAVVAGLLLEIAGSPLLRDERVTWDDVDYEALEEVQLLREYVRIDTSRASGSSLAGARFLARELEESGIPYHLEPLGETEANLWAVLEGTDPGAVVLHHHIDVEDVHDWEAWEHPPFSAEIDPPWLYGRGTFDMKSVGIAQLMAFIDLAKSGARLKRSVILLATTGEETGSELGTRWLLDHRPELVERFDVVLTEGGVLEGRSLQDIKYWGTEFAQKRSWTVVACDPSRERLEQLQQDIREFQRFQGLPPRLVLEVRRFLPYYAPTRDREELRRALGEPDRVLRNRAVFESLPKYVQAMFRSEIHPFRLEAAAGGGWRLEVNVLLLPGVELEEVREDLLPEWLFYGVETELYSEPLADSGSPIHHPVMNAIEEVLKERYPDAPVGPIFLPWTATDSRFFRARSIPSYGFSPFRILTADVLRVGQVTERIPLESYVEGVAIYRDLLRRLVT